MVSAVMKGQQLPAIAADGFRFDHSDVEGITNNTAQTFNEVD